MNTVALVITTYNWPKALDLVFASVEIQTRLPDEIHVADDGSTEETTAVVKKWQEKLSVPVHHHWQEDNGFRPNIVRNESAAASTSDIMITVDGDMILHPHFVEDHVRFSKPGYFIQSRRVRLDEYLTEKAQAEEQFKFSWLEKGITRRFQAIHSRFLAVLTTKADTSMKHIRGANMSMWHKDYVAINGMNEDIEGWGFCDHDLTTRFYNLGLRRTYVRHAALAYHLEHGDNSRDQKGKNKKILEMNQAEKIARVPNGLAENHTIKRTYEE